LSVQYTKATASLPTDVLNTVLLNRNLVCSQALRKEPASVWKAAEYPLRLGFHLLRVNLEQKKGSIINTLKIDNKGNAERRWPAPSPGGWGEPEDLKAS
jgi:hypothetical protein